MRRQIRRSVVFIVSFEHISHIFLVFLLLTLSKQMLPGKVIKMVSKIFWTVLLNPSRSDPGRREKINLNFYFHTSLWYLKEFKDLHKTFWGTKKKNENKNLS